MTRDMTKAQFRAALKRNGFRFVMGWIDRPNDAGGNRLSVGCFVNPEGGIYRRESLAKAIREFKAFDAKEMN